MKSYVCRSCRAESYSAHDIAHRYCGRCHQFEDDLPLYENRMSMNEQHRIEEWLKGSKASGCAAQEAQWISEHPLGEKS